MPLVDPDDENQKIIFLPDTNLSPRPSSPVSPKATPNTFAANRDNVSFNSFPKGVISTSDF